MTLVPERRIARFDKNSHNLLGMLQLVSKALGMWFGAIAVGLMYQVAARFASGKHGFSLRLLSLPNEFTDLFSIFDISTWMSTRPRARTLSSNDLHHPQFLRMFVLLGVVLCIICNLMGPATAVLAIPALQWVDTDAVGDQYFQAYITASQPETFGWAFNDSKCSEEDFTNLAYSCTAETWGATLDAWFASSVATAVEADDGETMLERTSKQKDVRFGLNFTEDVTAGVTDSYLLWVPSRQVLDAFSKDKGIIANISIGQNATSLGLSSQVYNSYVEYNKSLELEVQRVGPIVGTIPNTFFQGQGGWWTTAIDSNRSVLCFSSYELDIPISETNNFTKCIQVGGGWSDNVKQATFVVNGTDTTNGVDEASERGDVIVIVNTSDRAVFLPNGTFSESSYQYWNGTETSFDPACIGPFDDTTVPTELACDWDWFFSYEYNDYSTSNVTDSTTIRFTQTVGNTSFSMAIDFVVYVGFALYTFDPQYLTNPLRFVQTPDLPTTGATLAPDPAWVFAAWSVDFYNGTLAGNRTAPLMLLQTMDLLRTNAENITVNEIAAVSASFFLPILQTLSLLDYTTTTDPSDAYGPLMELRARLYVWAYRMSSRTAYMGAIVVSAGILVVLIQLFFRCRDRSKSKGLTELLTAALAHEPQDEFNRASTSGLQTGRVRFHLIDEHQSPGGLKFRAAHA